MELSDKSMQVRILPGQLEGIEGEEGQKKSKENYFTISQGF